MRLAGGWIVSSNGYEHEPRSTSFSRYAMTMFIDTHTHEHLPISITSDRSKLEAVGGKMEIFRPAKLSCPVSSASSSSLSTGTFSVLVVDLSGIF